MAEQDTQKVLDAVGKEALIGAIIELVRSENGLEIPAKTGKAADTLATALIHAARGDKTRFDLPAAKTRFLNTYFKFANTREKAAAIRALSVVILEMTVTRKLIVEGDPDQRIEKGGDGGLVPYRFTTR